MTLLQPIAITASTIEDAWYQLLYKAVEVGRVFKIDEGSFAGQKRLEFDFITVHIKYPGTIPLLPQVPPAYGFPNPVADDYLDNYLPYLMTGEEKEGESYTYGQRINKCDMTELFNLFVNDIADSDPIYKREDFWGDRRIVQRPGDGSCYLSQMELAIWTYKNKGHRNNQMILQVGQPNDMLLIDPPCLRSIDTRIQDGKLHFFPYFRSWDLFGGFPANLAAIEMMKQYMASEIGVENGEIIATSKGLHIYDYVFEIAEALRGKTMEEFRNERGCVLV